MQRTETMYGILHIESGDMVDEWKLFPTRKDAANEFHEWFGDDWESYAIVEVVVSYDDGRDGRGSRPQDPIGRTPAKVC